MPSEARVNRSANWWIARVISVLIGLGAFPADALDWVSAEGSRSAAVAVVPGGVAGFSRLSGSNTGVQFTNRVPESRHLTNQIYLNGSGVAAGDVDGDGWCDLYFSALHEPNRLFRNLGNWKFEETALSAGVDCPGMASTGVALADLEGDTDLDLVVNSIGGGTRIFYNQGGFRFTPGPILNAGKGGMSLALADTDGDGLLDLYVTNYRTSALMDIPNARATFKRVGGRIEVDRLNGRSVNEPDLQNRFVVSQRRGVEELGEADAFYRNQGGTNFVLVPFGGGNFLDAAGVPLKEPLFEWGLDAMFRDMNGDTFPDLYVCNDFYTEDRIWLNDGTGRFRAAPPLTIRKTSLFSMGIDFADINRDGLDDFLVVDMLSRNHAQRMTQMGDMAPPLLAIGEVQDRPQYGLNTLFLNRGDGTYAEIAALSGLEASDWSWTPLFLDVDLDGWEDLLISNGNERAARDLDVAAQLKAMRARKAMSDAEVFEARRLFPRLAPPNLAFRNRGDLTFEEVGAEWGFGTEGVSHGMAVADLDNDGDLDLVINNFNNEAGLYRNNSSAPRVGVRLKGSGSNSRGIGARVTVRGGAVPLQSQEIVAGGRYLSSDDSTRVFAAGSPTNRLTLEVIWRSGRVSVVPEARANRIYEIDEAGATMPDQLTNGLATSVRADAAMGAVESGPLLFQDVSAWVDHRHHEEPFDDFARQPLLPRRLSQLGPGLGWHDLDGDGWEDLMIGSGKGGAMGVYHNDSGVGFTPWSRPPFTQPVTRDQTSVIAAYLASGQIVILTGSSNHEDGLPIGAQVRAYDPTQTVPLETTPGDVSSAGPLALADVDGDGDLDLFVGGRAVPARFPAAATSRLFRNEAGELKLDGGGSEPFAGVGLVSGAVFSDLDGDGDPDLVLACEWGPVRVFRNESGRFVEATASLGLHAFRGWWNGVTTGDFDGDGRLDIVASNWGRNATSRNRRSGPFRIYHGDFDGDGSFDLVETSFDTPSGKHVPELQLLQMARALPFLGERFASNAAYAAAGIEEVLGERLPQAAVWEADWFESTVFLNRGDRFEPKVLPVEAQMAPAFGVSCADLDGDGDEDLVLSQNFFAMQPGTPRQDAGLGLVLKGNGKGGFQALGPNQSGVRCYGEQRAIGLADFDRDGRVDVAIGQNGGTTKLFRNATAKPGLRIRLQGEDANPMAIGATIRMLGGEGEGPVREIHAGSGYWSQDSALQVLARLREPLRIRVRWPKGNRVEYPVPKEASEVRIRLSGGLELVR